MRDNLGVLAVGEPHPMAYSAKEWIIGLICDGKTTEESMRMVATYQGVMASCALSGNRAAEVCGETLRKLVNGEPVGDRYLLGLAWMLREMNSAHSAPNKG